MEKRRTANRIIVKVSLIKYINIVGNYGTSVIYGNTTKFIR